MKVTIILTAELDDDFDELQVHTEANVIGTLIDKVIQERRHVIEDYNIEISKNIQVCLFDN